MSRIRLAPFAVLATAALAATLASPVLAGAGGIDLARARLVDLTHPFNNETVYWPTSPSGFGYAPITSGKTEGGWFYSAGAFQAPEHGGTHMDAPVHFKEGGATADKVGLEHLVAPLCVIDITTQANSDADYAAALTDLVTYETRYGPIPRGAIVVLRTGWSSKWPDKKAYLGDDTPGDASNLHFPGFGEEIMRMLVEQRGAAGVGLDTASLDPGKSTDFMAHRISAAAGVPGFENLTNLDQLPGKGAWMVALPMKIENGTGGPLRAVAIVPEGQ